MKSACARFAKAERDLERAETKWNKEWDDILCPFEKVKMYCSDEKRTERKKILDEYVAARAGYRTGGKWTT